jgi:F-type H+-transporting ATPase subunit c
MTPEGTAWLAAGLAIGIAGLGTAIGIGIAAGKSVEAAARQPEAANSIQRMMIIGVAFIEMIALYALLVALILSAKGGKGPGAQEATPSPVVAEQPGD